jgi:hypothetical protein
MNLNFLAIVPITGVSRVVAMNPIKEIGSNLK